MKSLLKMTWMEFKLFLRGLWIGESWRAHLLDAGVLVGLLIVGVVVSVVTFRWE